MLSGQPHAGYARGRRGHGTGRPEEPDARGGLRRRGTGRRGDRLFGAASRGSAILVLGIVAAIAVFLIAEAVPALRADRADFLTSQEWSPDAAQPRFGVAQLAFGTLLTSLLALVMAAPVAIGGALFIACYAPRRLAPGLGYVVDLLAAVPSVVYGLWGLRLLVPAMGHVAVFLHDDLGWIPLFGGDGVGGQSVLTAAVVLAIMIVPIVSSVSREVFVRAPAAHAEAALALGATRWEVVRLAVLPFGRTGMVSAALLGLGRALGETIAVAMVLSTASGISWHILRPGGNTFAANIANTFGMAGSLGRSALIASGLTLFVIKLIVNMAARAIARRGRSG